MNENDQERMRTGRVEIFSTDRIEVIWEPRHCIHASRCWRSLPDVFLPMDRPWVHPDQATPDEISRVILTCPTGALHFRRLDGGPQETPDDPSTITEGMDGPLYVRGDVRIYDEEGNLIRQDTRVALCRCGHSSNKPFCDNSHRRVGFRSRS